MFMTMPMSILLFLSLSYVLFEKIRSYHAANIFNTDCHWLPIFYVSVSVLFDCRVENFHTGANTEQHVLCCCDDVAGH